LYQEIGISPLATRAFEYYGSLNLKDNHVKMEGKIQDERRGSGRDGRWNVESDGDK
jgi:hypothetical protein